MCEEGSTPLLSTPRTQPTGQPDPSTQLQTHKCGECAAKISAFRTIRISKQTSTGEVSFFCIRHNVADADDQNEGAKTEAGEPPAKLAKADLYRAPDAQEVLEIAHTRNLYKSNLFRLQLEELVKELVPKKVPAVEAALHSLKPLLLGKVKAREIPADMAAEFPQLFFQQRSVTEQPMKFLPPKRLDVVGSFLLGTYGKTDFSVDVAVEMPSEIFRSKDYLNFRYHDKRTAYVGELHRQLSHLLEGSDALSHLRVDFEAFQGDPYRPCLVLRPEVARWAIRLLPTYLADLWPTRMLAADRNAVRPAEGGGEHLPTPQYNNTVLEDARMREHLETLHAAVERFSFLRDAIRLLKRWASSCGFISVSADRVISTPLNGFMLSMLAAHAAITGGVAPAQTTSFQLFKLALSVLSTTRWESQKVTFGVSGSTALSSSERVGSAHFYDSAGVVNFFGRLGPAIEELRWEAQRALSALDQKVEPFEAVFGRDVSPEVAWDLVLRTVELPANAMCPDVRSTSSVASSSGPVDAPEAMALAQQLRSTMLAGLGDRCVRCSLRLLSRRQQWSTEDEKPLGPAVMLGMILASEHLERVIDRGPSAQQEEASKQFRELWGPDKAELRRFKDGSILECVVWKKPERRTVEPRKEPAVVTQIVHHLLSRHIRVQTEAISGPIGFVENLGEQERRLWITFDTFRTHLCQLSSLPLAIKDIHPAEPAFSYMATDTMYAPSSASHAGGPRPLHETVLEFESSGRWPDDTAAARKVAAALLLQIRDEIASDLGIESDAAEDFLDVRYPDVVFRLRIFHPHEMSEVAQKVTNPQAPGAQNAAVSDEALGRLRSLWWRPRIYGALHALALQHPALAGATRLFKRWMSSQMLSGYEEFAEHLVAFVFLHPEPYDVPSSAHIGFCRTLLLLQSFDWHREALLVDIDGKIKEEERLALRQAFEKHLSTLGAKVSRLCRFWVSTRFDPHGMLLVSPGATLCAWLRQRALVALQLCRKRMLGLETNWRGVFQLDTTAVDVILQLLPQQEQSKDQVKGPKAAEVSQEAAEELVRGLQQKLSSLCLVLYDRQRRLLALKWRPNAFLPQPQTVLMGSAPHTVITRGDEAPLCVPNVLCILSQVSALAEGLALDLEMKAS
eukprot:s111_g8.t1